MRKRKQFDSPPKRVALFVTCMVDLVYPEVGMDAVELLERSGVEVVFPYEQTCCGQPAFNAGYRDEARDMAEHYLDVFEPFVKQGVVDAIVVPSGSCGGMVTHFYPVLFEEPGMEANKRRAEALAEVTFELTEFLVDVLGITDVGSEFTGKITFHASCHTLREMQVDRQPRTLIDNIAGAEFVELEGHDECCGFGGLFAIKNAEISTAMGQRKCANIAHTSADVVTLCDVSCMSHINGMLEKQGQTVRAVHIAQILNHHPSKSNGSLLPQILPSVSSADSDQEQTSSAPPAPAPEVSADEAEKLMSKPKESDSDPNERPRRWQDIR